MAKRNPIKPESEHTEEHPVIQSKPTAKGVKPYTTAHVMDECKRCNSTGVQARGETCLDCDGGKLLASVNDLS